MNTSYSTPNGIATASISVTISYNKYPDADFIETSHENMDAIAEYFKDHVVYKYCTDLTMDGQLKFKGKPVIAYIGQSVGSNKDDKTTKGYMTHDEIKKMINKLYGYGFRKENANV